jgi:hypothetical protein
MENEIITINQGRPRSPYFVAAESPKNFLTGIGSLVKCVNPRTNQETKGKVIDYWTFEWKEAPKGLLLLAYGVDPEVLRKALIDLDKSFEDESIRILLIREMI